MSMTEADTVNIYALASKDPTFCLADNTKHESLEALLKHLRKLKITQELYYTDHAPQQDLCTGEVIPFKAPASRYVKTEFAHKNNLKRWVKEKPEEAKKWAVQWLKNRRLEKGLIYPPTQTELRSLMCPTIPFYDHIGGYNRICAELGYVIRFGDAVPSPIPLKCPVIVDTREQKPLKLKVEHVAGTIKCGDYGLPAGFDYGIYIERKSLSDFSGTLSGRFTNPEKTDSNLLRFTRELERAKETDSYIVMLVEVNINDAFGIGFNGAPNYGSMNPDHLFHNLRDLLSKFDNFQALFVSGRKEAVNAVPQLLSMGEKVKTFDLQLAYETGKLNFK